MRTYVIPPYNYILYIFVNDAPAKVIQSLTRSLKRDTISLSDRDKEELGKPIDGITGYFCNISIEGRGVMWISEDCDPTEPDHFTIISHECNHCAIDIFDYIGSSVNKETEEPFCYLHDYLIGKTLAEINRYHNELPGKSEGSPEAI